MRAVALLAAALLAALACATVARADGDPASDFLLAQRVFFNPEEIPKAQQQQLTAAVRSANANGFPIRVAVIWSDYDLGAVTSLWGKPRRYATFLSLELTYYYKGRLLVVMPSGFGFHWPKHEDALAYATLASLHAGSATPAALAQSAVQAVQRLARAAGVTVATSGPAPARHANRDRLKIVLGVVVLVLLGAAVRFLIRRRASG